MRAHHWIGAVILLAVGFFVGAWYTRTHGTAAGG